MAIAASTPIRDFDELRSSGYLIIEQVRSSPRPDVARLEPTDTIDSEARKPCRLCPKKRRGSLTRGKNGEDDNNRARNSFHEGHFDRHNPQPEAGLRRTFEGERLPGISEKRAFSQAEGVCKDITSLKHSRKSAEKLAIVMVGLPARGKSYIAKKLCRYMEWLQYETKLFNVGNKRRQLNQTSDRRQEQDAKFFSPDDAEASKIREAAAMETLNELLEFLLCKDGSVALFDATNTTRFRREVIMQRIKDRAGDGIEVLFLETQCFDEELLERNMRLKLSGPDYKGHDPVLAIADFRERVAMYERRYIALGSFEEQLGWSFCQMIDVGRKFITHNIRGDLALETIHYLQHFHLEARQIWLTCPDLLACVNGDTQVDVQGRAYASGLVAVIDEHRKLWAEKTPTAQKDGYCDGGHFLPSRQTADKQDSFRVWSSNFARSRQLAAYFRSPEYDVRHLKLLDGSSIDYSRSPTDYDTVQDFKPVALDVEKLRSHVLLIAEVVAIRVLLAYFLGGNETGTGRQTTANLPLPTNAVYLVQPVPYGVVYKVFMWDMHAGKFKEKQGHIPSQQEHWRS
ncbi:6-phosphofructo-2-kinase [Cladophialophora chaetospira]|uniref:6-phosphofructo-2-kinase n=1 Tax=Cladophialophora chaetospira TaxID=386627 RepID=A0AA38XI01_9EURO|nr:6-phosphofructo-2-kinase [Cladophialophora chaetospira]